MNMINRQNEQLQYREKIDELLEKINTLLPYSINPPNSILMNKGCYVVTGKLTEFHNKNLDLLRLSDACHNINRGISEEMLYL